MLVFEIEYKGGNTVIISTKKETIIVDPKRSVVGLSDIEVTDAIEIATEARFAVSSEKSKLVIEGPGEYGVGDFDISGIAAQRHLDSEDKPKAGTMYRIEVSDVRIGLIGNIYEKISDEQLEALGLIDILIVPVGGNGYTLDAVGAASLVAKIDPKIVIPVHYASKELKYEVPQDSLEAFVKELGVPVEVSAKYKVKSAASIPLTLTVLELSLSK